MCNIKINVDIDRICINYIKNNLCSFKYRIYWNEKVEVMILNVSFFWLKVRECLILFMFDFKDFLNIIDKNILLSLMLNNNWF